MRPAVPQDAPALTALFLAARRAAMPWLPELYSQAQTLQWMEAMVLPQSRVFVADDEAGVPAGFAALTPGHLDHLYVAPAAQGRGLGDALLHAAKAASPAGLTLHVFQRNVPARRFYARRGFHLLALRDGQENEEREPDAIYAWRPG